RLDGRAKDTADPSRAPSRYQKDINPIRTIQEEMWEYAALIGMTHLQNIDPKLSVKAAIEWLTSPYADNAPLSPPLYLQKVAQAIENRAKIKKDPRFTAAVKFGYDAEKNPIVTIDAAKLPERIGDARELAQLLTGVDAGLFDWTNPQASLEQKMVVVNEQGLSKQRQAVLEILRMQAIANTAVFQTFIPGNFRVEFDGDTLRLVPHSELRGAEEKPVEPVASSAAREKASIQETRSEIRPVTEKSLMAMLKEAGYAFDSLFPLEQVVWAAEGTVAPYERAELREALVDRLMPAKKTVAFDEQDQAARRDLRGRVEFLRALFEDSALRQKLGLPDVMLSAQSRGAVLLSTSGPLEAKLELFRAALPFFASLEKPAAGSPVAGYIFAGAGTRETRNLVLQRHAGLSASEVSALPRVFGFDLGRSVPESVARLLKDPKFKRSLVALAGRQETQGVLGRIFAALENPADFEAASSDLPRLAESFYYRARLLKELAAQIETRKLEAAQLGRALSDDYWVHFVSTFLQRQLPDVVVKVRKDGSFDLSLSQVSRQLDVFRASYQAVQSAA
ncbi:MAG TPA: hypothetical protein VL688_02150, partial [Verrucomicrobiae bacterium]|nr:hypothetical protein [Verrucomicrobiae bacterium]